MDRGPLVPIGLNRVTLLGVLAIGPLQTRTHQGSLVVTIVVGTQRYRTVYGDGPTTSRKMRTDWHRVVAWGSVAHKAAEQLKQGMEVYVEGPLINREWRDRESKVRRATEIRATQISPVGLNRDPSHGMTGVDIDRAEAFAAPPPPDHVAGD